MRPSALTLPVADPQQPPFAACAACFTTATESALPSAATLSRKCWFAVLYPPLSADVGAMGGPGPGGDGGG